MKPELHRPLALVEIGASGLECTVEADPAECAALAARLDVPAVLSLCCRFHLARAADRAIVAQGRLLARVVRICVVSLDEFETDVTEDFRVCFVPAGTEADPADPEADDEIPFTGGAIDLGEAAAQQLALALDPYPRKPGAELPETEAAVHERH